MKVGTTPWKKRRVNALGVALALAILPAMGAAQEVDHSKIARPAMAHPHAGHGAAAKPAPMAQAEVNRSVMGHGAAAQEPVDYSTVDHSAMGHNIPEPKPERPVDHSPFDHSAMGHDIPIAPTEPLTPIPEIAEADRVAAMPPPHAHPMHDNNIFSYVSLNRLEAWDAGSGIGMQWEAQSWIGTDLDRVWLRSQGERVNGHTQSSHLEVLYGRSITPWWDVVGGIRHDFRPGRSQDFVAIGVIGLAPYMFEVSATAYLGKSGRTEASVEVEYEVRFTNRLILQPVLEVNLFGKTDERRGVGSGLGIVEAGMRVRYEANRQLAPYVGVVRERAFGRTAERRRNKGEDADDMRVVAGVRIWF